MPQLDKFTFGTQVVWLIFVFFVLYFLLVCTSLPIIYRVLLFRTKKISALFSVGSLLYVEGFAFKVSINNFLSTNFSLFQKMPVFLNKITDFAVLCSKKKFISYKFFRLPNFFSYTF